MLTTIPPTLHSRAAPGRRPRLRTSASSPSRHRLRRLPQPCPDVPAGRSSAPSRAPPAAARRPTRATPTQPWLLRRHDRPPPPPPASGGRSRRPAAPGPSAAPRQPGSCPSRERGARGGQPPVRRSRLGWAEPARARAPGRQGRRGRAGGAGGRVDGGQDGPPRSPRASGRTGPGGGTREEKEDKEEKEEKEGPGGRRTFGQRGGGARDQKRACLASPSGNRTPVSRVTGGDTHHYTNEDGGGGRPGARPLSARPPPAGLPACPRPPGPSTSRAPVLPGARHVPRATAHPARPPGRRVSAHSSPPARLGASRPRTRRRPRPPSRAGMAAGEDARHGKQGCASEPEAPRRGWAAAGGGGGGGRTPAAGCAPREGEGAAARTAGGRRRRAERVVGPSSVAHGASRRAGTVAVRPPRESSVRRPSVRRAPTRPPASSGVGAGSQPGERRRAQARRGWPSGLRRCVQVAVSPGGVGSNPTLTRPPFGPPNAGSPHPGLDDALSVPPYTPLRAAGRAAGCGWRRPGTRARDPRSCSASALPATGLAPPRPPPPPPASPSFIPRRPGGSAIGKSAARLSGGSVCPLPSRRRPLQASRGPKCRQPRAGRATLPLRGASLASSLSQPRPTPPPPARRERGVPTACPFRRPPFIPWSPPSVPGRPRRGHPEASPRPHARRRAAEPSRASRDGTTQAPVRWAWPGGEGWGPPRPWFGSRGAPERKAALPPGPHPRGSRCGAGGLQDASALPHRAARQPAAGGRSAQAHLAGLTPTAAQPAPDGELRAELTPPFFGLLAWALLGGPPSPTTTPTTDTHAHPHPPPPPAAPRERTQSELRAPAGPAGAHCTGRRAIRPWAFGGAPGGKGRSALSCAGHDAPLPGNRARVRLGQAAPPGRTVSGGGPAPGRGRRVSRVRLGASLGPWAPRAGPSPSPSPSPSPRRICTGAEPVLQTAGPPPPPRSGCSPLAVPGRRRAPLGKPSGGRRHRCMGGSVVEILACTAGGPGFDSRHMQRAAPLLAGARPDFLAHALKPQGSEPEPAVLTPGAPAPPAPRPPLPP
ncbi:basic proline-rich protein-like [Canis lupus familiaris]|uniref:basic proline-rich protein-like n=1 Tax=Canis lupus familiaris TaxID=9615 RepID=UPI0018F3A1B2|nr:basic proline-rich protein-like [Canis lupus familiaris]